MIHTRNGLIHAETMTKLLFDSDYSNLRATDIIESLRDDPRLVLVNEVDILQTPLPKLAAKYGLVASNSAAKALVQARGLYLNNAPIPDVHFTLTRQSLISDRIAILRAGKDKLLILATV
jgi:tyrosyl-tRNA synthetase